MDSFSSDMVRNAGFVEQDVVNPFVADGRVYDFEHAISVMTTITQQYGKARHQKCQQLKEGLTTMDPFMTGRLSLKNFYTMKEVGPWMLSESQEFLRQLGALDESSQSLGPRVIISNYIHAVSNCDNPSEYYSICCIHECHGLLNHLEVKIRAPTAAKEAILGLVMNLSSDSIEAPRNLSLALVNALDQVATLHNGKVPLHGRLFAQWMHYAFPHECPYPYVSGSFNPLMPSEWMKTQGSVIVKKD